MKIQALIISLLFAANVQSYGQLTGQINYEVVRKVDPANMRITINGEQVKPGDPNFPTDVPDTRTFGQKALYTQTFVREKRNEQEGMLRRSVAGGGMGGAPQTTNLGRPFEEQVFVDLVNQKTITLVTVGKDKGRQNLQKREPDPAHIWLAAD
jgi:hypothetical protein